MPDSPELINIPAFVSHVDVVLLGLFAVYVVLTLPRALVHLFQQSEILNGFFLHSESGAAPRTRSHHRSNSHGSSGATNTPVSPTVPALVDIPDNGVEDEKGQSSEAQRPALIIPPRAAAAADVKGSPSRRVPTRVPRWMRMILRPTLAYALNFRVAPGFSFGNLLVLLVYTALILYASLRHPNPLVKPNGIGYLAISQVPIAVALAGKTNWLGLACGFGYEKLNYIHRFVGRVIVILVNFHGLGNLYKWSVNGIARSRLSIPRNSWGLVALCAVDLLFLSSLSFVRKRMYTLFITIHVTCLTLILLATYLHRRACVPYSLIAVGLYAFDHLVRVVRTRHTTGWLTAEYSLNRGTTLVRVPSLRAGWRAGQHVRVRVVSSGWLAWLVTWFLCRARPFTIAAGSDSGGVVLQINALGSWTRNLLRVAGDADNARPARSPEQISTDVTVERGRGSAREVRVIIEGPYGGPGYTLYTAYSGAVLVAGGSGISYVMSILDDMLQKHANGKSHIRVIEVIWSVIDPDSLYALLPELTLLMQPRPSPHTSLSLRFNVHWTRVSARPPCVPRTALPPGMYIDPGRPDIFDTLQSVITSVRSAYSTSRDSGHPSGIVIGSCGPVALIDDAARAVGRVGWADWKDVGGVESIEEVFGL